LQRIFKQQTGVSPREFHASLRSTRLRKALRDNSSVTDSVYDAGFSSSSRFYESAGRNLGMPPAKWLSGGKGVTVRYTEFSSPLGSIVLAATAKGLCFLGISEKESMPEAILRSELPAATLERDDDALAVYRDVISSYFQGAVPHPDLPVDVQATAFQAMVWKILHAIPPGHTRTYSDIALELGSVNLTRAVARACATNPVSLVIPCHRVISKSGKLAGYRWGLDRKARLLTHEQA
jgi:AraC family transcriptional regulator of adaptative response/methylated-DNA-[protein]-cysteine methyltransferase